MESDGVGRMELGGAGQLRSNAFANVLDATLQTSSLALVLDATLYRRPHLPLHTYWMLHYRQAKPI